MQTSRRETLSLLCGSVLAAPVAQAQHMALRARSRSERSDGTIEVKEETLRWKPAETAIIVCDMWDNHYCQNAARRVTAMAPRMNQVLREARRTGLTVVHAPSGTMSVYAGMLQRMRQQNAPRVKPPVPILSNCPLDPGKEQALPVDDGTQPCDDATVGPAVRRYNRQNQLLEIAPEDGISDNGEEIYSYFRQKNIRNVVLMGVHTNMCVLGRSFGIRQQVRLGMNVVLARDLTDAMYDPRQRPWVGHDRGTELVIEHIERFWCPSIHSQDLTHVAANAMSAADAPAQSRPVIWDLHCHLPGEGSTPEEKMTNLIRFADRMGIERLCVYMGYPMLAEPSPGQLREQNDQVLRAIAKYPQRAFGFVYLSPQHVEFSLREFDRCVRNGPMVGVKLWIAKRASARELDPIIEAAASMNAVIFQHTWHKTTGNQPGESEPMDLVELASRHPKVPLILGHAGGEWETGIRAVRHLPNVSVELAGSDPTAGFVEMAVRELGAERVIYGSDAAGRSFASQLGKVTGANISAGERAAILSGNLKRMLQPILERKGIRI